MSKAKQDDLSRQRRLNQGKCPMHGARLVQTDYRWAGGGARPVVGCSRKSCDFEVVVRPGSKLEAALGFGSPENLDGGRQE
jgi:hypothetical protein